MKKWSLHIGFACLVVLASSFSLQAQNSGAAPQSQNQTLKPQFTTSDIAFILNTLAGVNITGNEVEAYIDVKNTFTKAFEQAQKEHKGENEAMTVELSFITAQNFWQLFQRASLPGSAAEKYMAVKNALNASAPKASGDVPAITPQSTGSKK